MASKPKPVRSEVVSRAGTVALVGRPNVGKSTLLNALLGERIAITSHHAQTTRDRIAGILTAGGAQFVFLDTPGLHRARHKLGVRMNEVARAAAAEADVVVFMTEPQLRRTAEGAAAVMPTLREEDRAALGELPANKPVILLVNKVDKVRPKSVLLPLLEGYARERDFSAVIPVSATERDGVEALLEEVARLLPEGGPLLPVDELSDKPLRFFVGEFVREQILRRTRQEVPHGVAVTVDSFEESPALVRIAVTVHVAKDSHKGIIIGDGGRMLASIGKAARLRVEELLGRKVHLATFVRSTPGWFDDEARLADMGYADGATRAPAARKRARKPRPAQRHRQRGPS